MVIADPNLFIRAAGEAMCQRFAEMVVANDAQFPPGDPVTAIATFVTDLAGLPRTDPRHDAALEILTRHHEEALAEASETIALRSTFMVACTSPGVLGMGL